MAKTTKKKVAKKAATKKLSDHDKAVAARALGMKKTQKFRDKLHKEHK